MMLPSQRLSAGLVAAALVAAASFTTPVYAESPVSIRFAHFLPTVSRTHSKVFVPMIEAYNKESGGAIKGKLYPGGSLGRNPAQQLQLVRDGVIDISFIIQSYTPGEFPDNSVMELPLLMSSTTEASVVHQRLFEQGLLRGYDQVKVLGLATTSAYGLHLNFPFEGVKSLAGKKIRAATGIQTEIVTALGATPIGGISVTQTSEALSRGVIDGTLLGWESMGTFKVTPVTTDHVQVALGFTPLMIAMNKAKYESLSPKAKAVVDKYSGEWLSRAIATNYEALVKSAADDARGTGKNNVQDLTAEQQAEITKLMQPVIDKWTANHPNADKLLAVMKAESAKIRAE